MFLVAEELLQLPQLLRNHGFTPSRYYPLPINVHDMRIENKFDNCSFSRADLLFFLCAGEGLIIMLSDKYSFVCETRKLTEGTKAR